MTLAQFEDYVRNRHNAQNDPNWSSAEIYALTTGRCDEIVSIIGLLQGTNSATSTVIGTQAYNFPTNFVSIKTLLYNGKKLSPISFNDWESQKSNGLTPSGEPIYYVEWNNQVLLVPTPDAVAPLTFYGEKEHPFIDNNTQTTIDIPSVLHYRLADGVIADMAAKDENWTMMDKYESIWINKHIPAFERYAFLQKRRGKFRTLTDADTAVATEFGVE